jgi:phage baseplate assembly protein W
MAETFINIRFPFFDSKKGYFLEMTKTSKDAIKSNLMHLLLTNKGERLYMPEFGTNLRKYIFEQNDLETQVNIKDEIQNTITKFIPNLIIDTLEVIPLENKHNAVKVRLEYTVTNNTFEESDIITIEL